MRKEWSRSCGTWPIGSIEMEPIGSTRCIVADVEKARARQPVATELQVRAFRSPTFPCEDRGFLLALELRGRLLHRRRDALGALRFLDAIELLLRRERRRCSSDVDGSGDGGRGHSSRPQAARACSIDAETHAA